MATRREIRHQREQRAAGSTAGAGRVGRGGQFVAPTPKGIRLAEPIPKSRPYVPPDVDPDPDESAAFAALSDPGRPARTANRRATPAAVSAAQLRMRGARTEPELDDEPEPEPEQDQEHEPELDFEAEQPETPQQQSTHPVSPFSNSGGAANPNAGFPLGTVFAESVPGLHSRPVNPEDTDRLWDWIRGDKDFGQAFFGRQFRTSMALHQFIGQMVNAEQHGVAILRAICYHEHHLGFAALAPILAAERTALMHIYLQPAVRNQLAQFVGPLVELAAKTAPGTHLAVYSQDEAHARLFRSILKPLGFGEHVMFLL